MTETQQEIGPNPEASEPVRAQDKCSRCLDAGLTGGAGPGSYPNAPREPVMRVQDERGSGQRGRGAMGDIARSARDGLPEIDTSAQSSCVPAATLVARYAAESRRLEALSHDLERLLGTDPALTRALGPAERKALQRIDYLRQALGDLAQSLERFVPAGHVELALVTQDLRLEDVVWRLRHGKPPDIGGKVELFD